MPNIIMADTKGGPDNLAKLMNDEPVYLEDNSVTKIRLPASSFRSIRCPNAIEIAARFSRLTIGIIECFTPNAVVGAEAFKGCNTLKCIVCKGPDSALAGVRPFSSYEAGKMQLEKVDFTGADLSYQSSKGIGAECFNGDTHFSLLILRASVMYPLAALSAFDTTPFGSGGSGGTIYIPKVLYDHLGDGSSLDYKAATNWATLDGYGTITWAQIEGSTYETQYADGTPITE